MSHKKIPYLVKCYYILNNLPFDSYYKNRILWELRKKISSTSTFCFPWKMRNGLHVSISSVEVLSEFGVGPNCFRNRLWEPHVEAAIKKLVKPNHVCLDIGANIGYFTSVLSKAVGEDGRVFAFEPVRNTFQQLESTISENRLTNTSAYNFGLGECDTSIEIRYDVSISGNASIFRKGDESQTAELIKIRKIDDFDEGTLPPCNFIKVDVEGNEINFIKGSIEYLKKSKPIILYEFNQETACLAGYEISDMVNSIKLIDDTYTHFLVWGDGHLIQADFNSLQVPLGAHIDCVAIPNKKSC